MRPAEGVDVFSRAVLVLFIDTVLAKRTRWIFNLKDSLVSWLEYKDISYSNGLSDELTTFLVALGSLFVLILLTIAFSCWISFDTCLFIKLFDIY